MSHRDRGALPRLTDTSSSNGHAHAQRASGAVVDAQAGRQDGDARHSGASRSADPGAGRRVSAFPGRSGRRAARTLAAGSRRPRNGARDCPPMLPCHVMLRTGVFQSRIEPELRERLAQLRDERHVNVSAWSRNLIAAGLDRELPPDLDAPKRQPLAGWRPGKLEDGWGAVLDGPDVAALAQDPRGTPRSIIDSRGTTWTATISHETSSASSSATPAGRRRRTPCSTRSPSPRS